MRTCSNSKTATGAPFKVIQNNIKCYENQEFIPEYCAITCYCNANWCNHFTAPRLNKQGEKKIQQSSSPTTSLPAILLGLPVTVFFVNIWWSYA